MRNSKRLLNLDTQWWTIHPLNLFCSYINRNGAKTAKTNHFRFWYLQKVKVEIIPLDTLGQVFNVLLGPYAT
jgi:hypothetical protein